MELSWTLLENGLDSLNNSVNDLHILQEDNEALDYKSKRKLMKNIVISLFHGLELVLKHRLYKENWAFIFIKIDEAEQTKLVTGDFKSVDVETAISRLEKLCNISIKIKKPLTDLRLIRNKLEHYRVSIDFENILFLTLNVLNVIMDFINDNIKNMNNDEYEELEELKVNLSYLKKYIEVREELLLDNINDNEELLMCPNCGKRYVIIAGNNNTIECKLCHHQSSPEDAATEYLENIMGESEYECGKDGVEFPQYICPHCDNESMVYDDKINDLCFCYNCGVENDLNAFSLCDKCGTMYYNPDDNITICNDCYRYIIDKD